MSGSKFQEALLGWYRANARSMPWRIPPGSASIPSGSGSSPSAGAPIPLGSGNAPPSIDALSELASGRVAEGREGLMTAELGPTPEQLPTLKGSGHPHVSPSAINEGSLSIDALSELASGRVAEGREGLTTTELGSNPEQVPTLKGSGHPHVSPSAMNEGSLSIDALSELASGTVAEGREGRMTTELGYTPDESPTLKGSGHPIYKNPAQRVYEVWVSEIMLQQTTVATVTPYYIKWLGRFPTITDLADASVDDVLASWQGLGYYRRAKMLHEGAQWVVQNGIPQDAKEWLAVPGVGRYTAGAIASIGQNEPAPLVDGNVERVVARLTANPASAKSLTDAAWKWAEGQLLTGHAAHDSPGDWNQALMELGATVCKPVNPLCGSCPVQTWCQAFADGQVSEYPAPKPKTEQKVLHHAVAILTHEHKFAIRPVPEGRWWAGLYEFPREESLDELFLIVEAKLSHFGQFNHVVTNHKITVDLYQAETEEPAQGLIWVTEAELSEYAIPAPAHKALDLWKKIRTQKTLWEPGTSPD